MTRKSKRHMYRALDTYADKEVKETCVQGLREGIPGVNCLFRVKDYFNAFLLTAPLAVHCPTGQFPPHIFLVNAEQVDRVGQLCVDDTRWNLCKHSTSWKN